MNAYQVKYEGGLDLSRGERLSDFSFPWSSRQCPATSFRAVWNERVFAFKFEAEDDDLVLSEAVDPGKAALGSDRVELFFASSSDLEKPYYGAEMDPEGRVYDYAATTYRQINPAWSFSTLIFSGRIFESGYSVSGQIQLEELQDLDLLDKEKMTVGVYRAEFSHHREGGIDEDWISWIDPGTEKPDFHVPSSFGEFHLVRDS
ncbi:MAG: sugar-binding protein [Verrucomicrobiales bacterium]|nr:sugar-binding protein [Verrucomicrobiales bacterium]